MATLIAAVPTVTKQGIKLLLLLSDRSPETASKGEAPEENAELLRLAVICCCDVELHKERQNVKWYFKQKI